MYFDKVEGITFRWFPIEPIKLHLSDLLSISWFNYLRGTIVWDFVYSDSFRTDFSHRHLEVFLLRSGELHCQSGPLLLCQEVLVDGTFPAVYVLSIQAGQSASWRYFCLSFVTRAGMEFLMIFLSRGQLYILRSGFLIKTLIFPQGGQRLAAVATDLLNLLTNIQELWSTEVKDGKLKEIKYIL